MGIAGCPARRYRRDFRLRAFPAVDSFAEESSRYYADHARREQLAMLESLRARVAGDATAIPPGRKWTGASTNCAPPSKRSRMSSTGASCSESCRWGIRNSPNSSAPAVPTPQINAACASTTQAVALAEDWIRAGRCRRVIVISADDITSDHLIEWFGAGFLASGAAATDEVVEEAALPFDRRRHGMIMGMGAAALVVESAEAARERGIRPICEVLSAVTANSAFHGTRLDVQHIGQVMEDLVAQAEARSGISRREMAAEDGFRFP